MKDKLLQSYYDLFINDRDYWATQRMFVNKKGDQELGYCAIRPDKDYFEPVTLDTIRKHVSGELTASWAAVDKDNRSKWCAWDWDTESDTINSVELELNSWRLFPLREGRRAGRSGHLWLFLDHPVPTRLLIRFNKYVLAKCAIAESVVEFFPKYPTAKSQLRGPLGVHRKPNAGNARGWFEGAPHDVEQQLTWLSQQRPSSSQIVIDAALRLLEHDEKTKPRLQQPRHDRQQFNRVPILDLVEVRPFGKDYAAQCPVCANEGHDKSRNNLRISRDGKKFCCVFGGPSEVHKARDIIAALSLVSPQ